MSLTPGQLTRLTQTPSLTWLAQRRGQVLHSGTIGQKLISGFTEAGMQNRMTTANMEQAAQACGHFWGQYYTPPPVTQISVATLAAGVFRNVHDAHIAQAVRTAQSNPGGGRTAPNAPNVNHIHIGGNANLNLLYDNRNGTALGIVNFHMTNAMTQGQRTQVQNIVNLLNTPTVQLNVRGDNIS